MVVLQSAPDATTPLKFLHLLEKHKLGDQLFGVDSQSGLIHGKAPNARDFTPIFICRAGICWQVCP